MLRAMDAFTPAVEIAAAIRRKELSPVEVADFYLERIERIDRTLNAFAHRADDDVRAGAKRAADRVATSDPDDLPPFIGVPLPIKNLNPVAGWPCTYGSNGASAAPRKESDRIVERFVAAGFVLLGMTNSPEFGTISYTESTRHGVTRNPWDTERTPGGSSGGAAAAVASGMAPIAHASDGGGSIRIPASCNGLVGLKASRARVANEFVELEGFVTEGVVSHTVADTAAALDVIGELDPTAFFAAPHPAPGRSWSQLAREPTGRLRIGFTTTPPVALPIDPACVTAVERTATALESMGHDVFEATIEVPDADTFVESFIVVWNTGSVWSPVEDWDAIEPLNAALRAAARQVDSLTFAECVRNTQRNARHIVDHWGRDFDVLITPTMATLPPLCGSVWHGAETDPALPLLNCYPMAVFTSLFNVTGLPAINVPVHHDDATGLPVGVQVVAPAWRDDLCLQVASQLEDALPWRDRRPPVS